jgi:hypothetical protein
VTACIKQSEFVTSLWPVSSVLMLTCLRQVSKPQAGTPHSTKHESIENKLIAQGSHGHASFREDNAAACHKLEEAMRATSHAASINRASGRRMEEMLRCPCPTNVLETTNGKLRSLDTNSSCMPRKWKGQSNFALERFVSQHRNAFVCLQAAAEHVTCQLPNKQSQVKHLLEAIQCNDAGSQAAMASVKTDQTPAGMQSDFEAAATNLPPYNSVQKKRVEHSGGKRGSADISDANGEDANVSAFGTKKSAGSSGVSLQQHAKAQCEQLDKAQKEELHEWRQGKKARGVKFKGKDSPSKKGRSDTTKAVASAVEKKVVEKMKAMELEKTKGEQAEACVMSIFKKMANRKVQISDINVKTQPATPTAPTLKSIL